MDGFRPRIQHRLARGAGDRWAMLPHAFVFVDPLFSTGIAWVDAPPAPAHPGGQTVATLPFDFEELLRRCHLLGLDRERTRELLPLLRSAG